MYNHALSSGDIQQLYNSNLAKYNTTRRTFTTILSGIIDGTYLYSGTASDLAGNTSGSSNRTLIIDKTTPVIVYTGSTPSSGTFTSGNLITGQFDITEFNLGQFIRNRNGS